MPLRNPCAIIICPCRQRGKAGREPSCPTSPGFLDSCPSLPDFTRANMTPHPTLQTKTDTPACTCKEIYSKRDHVTYTCRPIMNKPKPKPAPKEPEPAPAPAADAAGKGALLSQEQMRIKAGTQEILGGRALACLCVCACVCLRAGAAHRLLVWTCVLVPLTSR